MNFKLDLSMDLHDSLDGLGETFRAEGMSVAYDRLRVDGEQIQLNVNYDDLIMGKRIGQGACSSVNRARHRETNELYAVKLFNLYDKSQRAQMLKEIAMLLGIDCPTLIKLQGVYHVDGNIGIILEYMNCGSLDGSTFSNFMKSLRRITFPPGSSGAASGGGAAGAGAYFSPPQRTGKQPGSLDSAAGPGSAAHPTVPTLHIPTASGANSAAASARAGPLGSPPRINTIPRDAYVSLSSGGAPVLNHSELLMACIAYQVLWGLAYLHYEHNIHRDIKPGNILLNYDGVVKLSDFGISRNLSDNTVGMSDTAVGTSKYMSPERLLCQQYNESADVFALGLVLMEMLHNNVYPFGRGGVASGNGSKGPSRINTARGGMNDSTELPAPTSAMTGADFDDGFGGLILSPIDLLAEFETLDVDAMIDNCILPNTQPNLGVSRQMRAFLAAVLHFEVNDRPTALSLLQSSPWFLMYGITDLETAQSIIRSYLHQYVSLQEVEAPTPNTARSSAPSTSIRATSGGTASSARGAESKIARGRSEDDEDEGYADDFDPDVDLSPVPAAAHGHGHGHGHGHPPASHSGSCHSLNSSYNNLNISGVRFNAGGSGGGAVGGSGGMAGHSHHRIGGGNADVDNGYDHFDNLAESIREMSISISSNVGSSGVYTGASNGLMSANSRTGGYGGTGRGGGRGGGFAGEHKLGRMDEEDELSIGSGGASAGGGYGGPAESKSGSAGGGHDAKGGNYRHK